MPDRISNYRQVRLILQVPQAQSERAYFSIHAVGVRNGIPSSQILTDGWVPLAHATPTTEEILEALDACVRQCLLT